MRIPVQLALGTNEGRSTAVNGSRLVNLYAEAMPPDSKTPVAIYGTPGTLLFSALTTGPVLGMQVMNDVLYVMTATRLYSVNSVGAATDLGAITLSGRVSTATNGTQLVFVDGTNGYSYTVASGIAVLNGDGWYASNSVAMQDGYFIFNRAGTGQFFISDLFSVTFDPLKYATAEGAPDDTLAVLSDHRELWLFGEHSIEVWYNSGDPDFTFERMQGAFIEKGIGAAHSAAKIDNSVFWLGEDGIIYRANGYVPQRISTHAVEFSLETGVTSDAFAYAYTEEGHIFYVITFPSKSLTWCYDVSTGMWHERSHITWGRHHSSCYANCYGKHLVGDFQTGLIYSLEMSTYNDNGATLRRELITPQIHAGRKRASMYSFEIDMETGGGLVTGYGSDPLALLSWSDDGGNTWSNEYFAAIGKIGTFLTRVKWNRLGMFRQRQMKMVITDPIPVVIIAASAEVRGGRS